MVNEKRETFYWLKSDSLTFGFFKLPFLFRCVDIAQIINLCICPHIDNENEPMSARQFLQPLQNKHSIMARASWVKVRETPRIAGKQLTITIQRIYCILQRHSYCHERHAALLSRSSVDRAVVDIVRRSWARFALRSKKFFSLPPAVFHFFPRADAQSKIHGFISTF